ncbi:MAG: N-acetylneuraminate synthase family protein [Butyrivibrio sp.]|nr:N-acetylneuraminate synthase family protein [Butyrivibrio sp.]
MVRITLGNGRVISDHADPYIIAELNSSHDGKVETAKEMIDAAKACGCDCVKLQSYTTESLFAEEYYQSNRVLKRFVQKFSLEESQLAELAAYCRSVGIDCSSTPYSEAEAKYLAELDTPFIKISSMEINNLPFLQYIAGLGKPMILSTGMSTMEEIEEAVHAIEETGNRALCILHCVSVYPAPPEIINLNNIRTLQERFPDYPIGYSDHTFGVAVPCAATALGAAVIEKHFTLDHNKMGMENDMATEPDVMAEMVAACRNVATAMGSGERILTDAEKEYAQKMRRSLVATRDLAVGDVIAASDLTAKRPGTGLPPGRLKDVIGKTVASPVKAGYLIKEEHIGA